MAHPKGAQCRGTNKDGTRCKRNLPHRAVADYCPLHRNQSPKRRNPVADLGSALEPIQYDRDAAPTELRPIVREGDYEIAPSPTHLTNIYGELKLRNPIATDDAGGQYYSHERRLTKGNNQPMLMNPDDGPIDASGQVYSQDRRLRNRNPQGEHVVGEFHIGDRVTVIHGSAASRARPGDAGEIIGAAVVMGEWWLRVKLDRTGRAYKARVDSFKKVKANPMPEHNRATGPIVRNPRKPKRNPTASNLNSGICPECSTTVMVAPSASTATCGNCGYTSRVG